MRAFVVPPADVQADGTGIDALEGVVDGGDDASSPVEELVEGPIGEERVPLEGKVGGVDLQQQPVGHDRSVLGGEGAGDGPHVRLLAFVVAVVHGGGDDAG